MSVISFLFKVNGSAALWLKPFMFDTYLIFKFVYFIFIELKYVN